MSCCVWPATSRENRAPQGPKSFRVRPLPGALAAGGGDGEHPAGGGAQPQPGGRARPRLVCRSWGGWDERKPRPPRALVRSRCGSGGARSRQEHAGARPRSGPARGSSTQEQSGLETPAPARTPPQRDAALRADSAVQKRGLARLARPGPRAAGMDSARSPCEYRALPPAAFVCAPRRRSPLPARPGPASFVEPAPVQCFPLPLASMSPPQPPAGKPNGVAPVLALTPFSRLRSPSVAPVGPQGHLAGRPSWSPRDNPRQAVFAARG